MMASIQIKNTEFFAVIADLILSCWAEKFCLSTEKTIENLFSEEKISFIYFIIVLVWKIAYYLTLICLGFLGTHCKVGGMGEGGGVCKIIRIILESSSLARKFTRKYSYRKYIFQYQGPLNFADVRIFFVKIVPLLKAIVWELC